MADAKLGQMLNDTRRAALQSTFPKEVRECSNVFCETMLAGATRRPRASFAVLGRTGDTPTWFCALCARKARLDLLADCILSVVEITDDG